MAANFELFLDMRIAAQLLCVDIVTDFIGRDGSANPNARHQHRGKIERNGDIKAGKAPCRYRFKYAIVK